MGSKQAIYTINDTSDLINNFHINGSWIEYDAYKYYATQYNWLTFTLKQMRYFGLTLA